MTERLVTVARFSNVQEAAIARSKLDAAGFYTFLKNAEFSSVFPVGIKNFGDVQLQVPESEEEGALEVLPLMASPEELEQAYADSEDCIEGAPGQLPWRVIVWIAAVVGLLVLSTIIWGAR